MRPPRHRVAHAIRLELARVLAIVLGLAVIVGVLRGGSHYLYCPFMDEVVSEHCCAQSHEDASTFEAPDCCQTKEIGTLPSAREIAPTPELPAPLLLAFLPPLRDLAVEARHAPPPRFEIVGTGPPSPPRAKRAARLMVFLI